MPVQVQLCDWRTGVLPIFEMNLPEGALKERWRAALPKPPVILMTSICYHGDRPSSGAFVVRSLRRTSKRVSRFSR